MLVSFFHSDGERKSESSIYTDGECKCESSIYTDGERKCESSIYTDAILRWRVKVRECHAYISRVKVRVKE